MCTADDRRDHLHPGVDQHELTGRDSGADLSVAVLGVRRGVAAARLADQRRVAL
jgi:hypothetical protein